MSASSNMSGCNKVLVCDLNSGVKVTCTAVAVNSAGPSPVSNQHTDFTDVEGKMSVAILADSPSCQMESCHYLSNCSFYERNNEVI